MPDPEFTLAPGTNNWMQDFAWDPRKDEIFMIQNIRTANGRQTIKINRLGKADDQGVRHFISAMTLTDAGHGDVLGLQRKGNALLLWIITQNVQAKLDPTGTYVVYRISGTGRDRYERRNVTEVENVVNHTYGKAGPRRELRRWAGLIGG